MQPPLTVLLFVQLDGGATLGAPQRRASRLAPPHDQVLRNQMVGNRSIAAGSGPRFDTLILIRMSSGEALAYSTTTSK